MADQTEPYDTDCTNDDHHCSILNLSIKINFCPDRWNEHTLRDRGFKEQKQAWKLWFPGALRGPYSLASVSISLPAYQEAAFV